MIKLSKIFKKRPSVVVLHQGKDSKWYFHVEASNGRIVSDSGQGYSNKSNAKRAARNIHPDLEIVEE